MLIQSFSGIRGIYGKSLTDDISRRYAYCYFSLIKDKSRKESPKLVIGYDTRDSNQSLKSAIMDSFHHVIDVGIAPTPVIEFAVRHFKADGGVIITASHNEPEWNGFKFLDKDGAILRVKDAEQLISRFSKIRHLSEGDFIKKRLKEEAPPEIKRVEKRGPESLSEYKNFIAGIIGKEDINKIRQADIKVLLDPNGGAGVVAQDILEGLGIASSSINNSPGEFKRKIEPKEETLGYLKDIAKKEKADLAAGFDCDADRVNIMLPDGTFISGQYIFALIAKDILSKKEGQIIVTNDATSGVVKEIAEKHKATISEVEVGEINVVDEMIKTSAAIGGEGSNGGVIMPKGRCRDGILTLIQMMAIIAKEKRPIKDIINDLPKYYTITKNIKIDEKEIRNIKSKIKAHFKDERISEKKDTFGTLKIWKGNSWIFIRASRTEHGLLRIITDSDKESEAKELMDETVDIIS